MFEFWVLGFGVGVLVLGFCFGFWVLILGFKIRRPLGVWEWPSDSASAEGGESEHPTHTPKDHGGGSRSAWFVPGSGDKVRVAPGSEHRL